jgi:ACS family tartrate transporter-like MFS transporter
MPAAMMPQLRARAMSMFYIGAALASVIGLPLSGSLLNMHGMLGVDASAAPI